MSVTKFFSANATSKRARTRWTTLFLLCMISATVLGWSIYQKIPSPWNVVSFLFVTVWIASFLRLSLSSGLAAKAWLIATCTLSFAVPVGLLLLSSSSPRNAIISGAIIGALGSLSAIAVFARASQCRLLSNNEPSSNS